MFCGSTTGKVKSFRFPLTLPGEWIDYEMHGDSVTQIRISTEDRRLISAGRDGSLCVWEVRDGESPDVEFANEILITKSELEEKNKLVLDLQQAVKETKTESDYQLRLKDNQFADEIKKVNKRGLMEMNDLKQKIARLENEMEGIKRRHETEIKQKDEKHAKVRAAKVAVR